MKPSFKVLLVCALSLSILSSCGRISSSSDSPSAPSLKGSSADAAETNAGEMSQDDMFRFLSMLGRPAPVLNVPEILKVAFDCMKIGEEGKVSDADNKVCLERAQAAGFKENMTFQKPHYTRRFIDSIASNILRLPSAEYRQTVKQLATQGVLDNRLLAYSILTETQNHWLVDQGGARYHTYMKCTQVDPTLVAKMRNDGSFLLLIPFMFLKNRMAFMNAVPTYFREVAGALAVATITEGVMQGTGYAKPNPRCLQMQEAPAQIIYAADGLPTEGDIRRVWYANDIVADQLKTKMQPLHAYRDVVLFAVADELKALSLKGVNTLLKKTIKRGLPEVGPSRWTRWPTNVASFFYTVLIFSGLDMAVDHGFEILHQRQKLNDLRKASLPVFAEHGPDHPMMIPAEQMEALNKLTPRVLKLAHTYNMEILGELVDVREWAANKKKELCDPKTAEAAQKKYQKKLSRLRDSYEGGSHECRVDFEKYAVLQQLLRLEERPVDTVTDTIYSEETRLQLDQVIEEMVQTPEGKDFHEPARRVMTELRSKLAKRYKQGQFCQQGPGLLLQYHSALDMFPEDVRVLPQAYVETLMSVMKGIYTADSDTTELCAQPDVPDYGFLSYLRERFSFLF